MSSLSPEFPRRRTRTHAPLVRSWGLQGLMPTHVFLRLLMSALAAGLALHVWRQRR